MKKPVTHQEVEGPGPWQPELGANGQVEIYARYFDENRGALASGGVTPEEYLRLWDAGLLRFQQLKLPRPEGHPSHEEVEALLDGRLVPTSRNGSNYVASEDPNKQVRRNPPAYLTGDRVSDKAPSGPIRTTKLVTKKFPAQTVPKVATEKESPGSQSAPPMPELQIWEMVVLEYQKAAAIIRGRNQEPTVALLAEELMLPEAQVRRFLSFNPKFEMPRSQEPKDAPVARAISLRLSAQEKRTAVCQAVRVLWERSDKTRALKLKQIAEEAVSHLPEGKLVKATSLEVELYSLFSETERDELRRPEG